MLLAVDLGNTNLVFAVFNKGKLLSKWRLSTDIKRTEDEYAALLYNLFNQRNIKSSEIKDIIIASVVPKHLFVLKNLCKNYFNLNPIIVTENKKLKIKILTVKPEEVGADRLVNSIAASKKYSKDCIIVDFGTATTFDVINKNGDYLGGVIAPGINLSLDALRLAAAKLPAIEVADPGKVIGDSTISAMQSGIFYGYLGLIEGLIARIKKEYGKDMFVIATGGLASLFIKATKAINEIDSDLTIWGLYHCWEEGSGKKKD